jgi:hypothetical protein
MINTEDTWEEAVREYLVASKHYSRMKKISWIRANMSGVARQVVYGKTFRKVAKFLHFRNLSEITKIIKYLITTKMHYFIFLFRNLEFRNNFNS